MRRLIAGAALLALAGCASLPAFWRPAGALLERADGLAAERRYADALAAYDDWLAKYPADGAAPRARMSRETVAALVAARDEIARLRRQVDDLGRLRRELTAREGELVRLRQEIDRVQADLENLKRLDLQMERGRR